MKLLLFTAHGGAELLDGDGQGARILWSSDNDQDFAEEFEDVLDIDQDEEDVLDYLLELGLLEEGEEVEIDERFLEDEDSANEDRG